MGCVCHFLISLLPINFLRKIIILKTKHVGKGRLQKQKTGLCGNNSHVGRPPPPSPSMGIFSMKCRFFSEDVQKKIFFENKICFLAPQDDFGMQKKNLVNKHKQVGMGQAPPPSMGNIPT